jgi:hypothetical protein
MGFPALGEASGKAPSRAGMRQRFPAVSGYFLKCLEPAQATLAKG